MYIFKRTSAKFWTNIFAGKEFKEITIRILLPQNNGKWAHVLLMEDKMIKALSKDLKVFYVRDYGSIK